MHFLNWRVWVCLGATAWLATSSGAATFTCDGGDVGCLVAAIHQANANGHTNTILLAAGTYSIRSVDNFVDGPTGLPVVTGRLTIRGASAEATIIERAAGAPKFRILDVSATGVVTVRQVTLRNGDTTGNSLLNQLPGGPGAGILAAGTVVVVDSVVRDNNQDHPSPGPAVQLTDGGGIAGGTVELTHSTVTHNFAETGGGVYIGPGGGLTVTQSTIADNHARTGAGVRFGSEGALTMDASVVDGNVIGDYGDGGAGLFIGNGTNRALLTGSVVTIRNSTVAHNNNYIGGGGGIAMGAVGTLLLSHSTVADNFAAMFGGGIAAWQGTATILESTVGRNGAREGGGAFNVSAPAHVVVRNSTIVQNQTSMGSAVYAPPDSTLENTILALNTGFGCAPFTSLGHNVIDGFPCVALQSTDITADPAVGAYVDPGRPGTGHYPLLAGSPAIDAGDNDGCGLTDQEGLTRPIDGNGDGLRVCDIGAIEFYPVVNDLVWLERVRTDYVPPDPDHVNPLAPGGAYRIELTYRNGGSSMPLCNLAFEVTTLTQTGNPPPALLDRDGRLIGYQGIALPASLAGGKDSLKLHQQDTYLFMIGVSQKAPFVFNLNVLGESTVASCEGSPAGGDRHPRRELRGNTRERDERADEGESRDEAPLGRPNRMDR